MWWRNLPNLRQTRQKCRCPSDDPVKGKVVLVTGGARGIGLATCKELLRCGARAVMIADRDAEYGTAALRTLSDEFGLNKSAFVKTNVCDFMQLEHAFKSTLAMYKKLDIVVNNASILDEQQWDDTTHVNIRAMTKSVLLGFKYMGKHRGRSGGVIVNISSVMAFQEAPFCPIHGAAAAYVINLGRNYGNLFHYCKTRVKIITLCPGITETPMMYEVWKKGVDEDQGVRLQKEIEKMPCQPPGFVGHAVICAIFLSDNGNVWVVEGCKPMYRIKFREMMCLKDPDCEV